MSSWYLPSTSGAPCRMPNFRDPRQAPATFARAAFAISDVADRLRHHELLLTPLPLRVMSWIPAGSRRAMRRKPSCLIS